MPVGRVRVVRIRKRWACSVPHVPLCCPKSGVILTIGANLEVPGLAGGSAIIAVDAMGGDNAPGMVVQGLALARKLHPSIRYVLFGDNRQLEPLLSRYRRLRDNCDIRHTELRIGQEDKPSAALRGGRHSSMGMAISAVARGEADAVISAGNTGALMALAKFMVKTLPGIDRPAMASLFPTMRGQTVLLDLGANLQCSPRNLVEFALMGQVFARIVLGIDEPSVGLLNIGTEEQKGDETRRTAAEILRRCGTGFHGFVEGDDIAAGTVDVVATDGFTGNVALKAIEGFARLYSEFMRRSFSDSLQAKIGFLFARPAFRKLRLRLDPRRYNGAVFLGLNGICVKSHGGTDPRGYANAVDFAVDAIHQHLLDKINHESAYLATRNGVTDASALGESARQAV